MFVGVALRAAHSRGPMAEGAPHVAADSLAMKFRRQSSDFRHNRACALSISSHNWRYRCHCVGVATAVWSSAGICQLAEWLGYPPVTELQAWIGEL